MFTVVITERGGAQRRMDFDKPEVTIGRVQGNDIILAKGNVSKRHSRIVLKEDRFVVVDLKSTNGTYVNGRKITSPLVVQPGDKIYIGDFILGLEGTGDEAMQASQEDEPYEESPSEEQASLPPPLPGEDALPPDDEVPSGEGPQASFPPPAPEREDDYEPPPSFPPPQRQADSFAAPPLEAARVPPLPRLAPVVATDHETALLHLMSRLGQAFDTGSVQARDMQDEDRWHEAQQAVEQVLGQMQDERVIDDSLDTQVLAAAAVREAVGLGPIDDLLAQESLQQVIVEGPNRVSAGFREGLAPVAAVFSSPEMLQVAAQRLAAQAGVTFELDQPICEGMLPYGFHVTVVQPPVAVRGLLIELRRAAVASPPEALLAEGAVSSEMLETLRNAVASRDNILVIGPARAAVTTVVGALAAMTDESERMVSVEDAPSLVFSRPGVVALSASNGARGKSFSDVLRCAERLASDRLVLDGAPAASAMQLCQVLCSRGGGHIVGVPQTVGDEPLAQILHWLRLEATGSEDALRALLGRCFQWVVRVEASEDGPRVSAIYKVQSASDRLQTQPLHVFADGQFRAL